MKADKGNKHYCNIQEQRLYTENGKTFAKPAVYEVLGCGLKSLIKKLQVCVYIYTHTV